MRATLTREDGAALIATIALICIASLLIVALALTATQTSNGARYDTSSKRALAAAEAGLQVARYRLNKINPDDAKCLATQPVALGTPPASDGQCPPGSGSVGNGASYQYYVYPVYQTAGDTCAGQSVQAAGTTLQRCITAVGTADGRVRRLQELVSATPGTPLFPFSGILGLNSVNLTQNGFGDLSGRVGSNGNLTLKSCKTSGSASQVTWDPGPGATLSNSCSGTIQTASPPRTQSWSLAPLDSKYGSPNTADPANNDNATVFSGRSDFTYDPTAGKRSLKDNTNATLSLSGANPRAGSGGFWLFNFCEMNLTHTTQIVLLNGAKAQFLIDSSQRSGSNCTSAGKLTVTNVSDMNYDRTTTPANPGDPTALQFYFYGTASPTVSISNQSGFSAAIYAPQAEVKFTNKTTYVGSIAAQTVTVTNGLDFVPGDVSSIVTSGGSERFYSRQDWSECSGAPTDSSNPLSGC